MKRSLVTTFALAVIFTILAIGQPLHAAPPPACCTVTAIDSRTGIVTAKDDATGRTFEFSVTNGALLATLHPGSPVYANFKTKQVSLDGTIACCAITSGPSAPHPMAPANGRGFGTMPSTPGQATAMGPFGQSIQAGTPHPRGLEIAPTSSTLRYDQRTVTGGVNGQTVSAPIIHLHGLDGIQQALAQGLIPQTVADILAMHVQALPLGQPDHYFVNPQLALEWSKKHLPEPPSLVGKASPTDSHTGCSTWSWHCAGEVVKHDVGEADKLVAQAQQAWRDLCKDLSDRWGQPADLFTESYKTLGKIPVAFNLPNQITAPLNFVSGPNGSVTGSATLGFPVNMNSTMDVSVFYVEALPFMLRPRSVDGAGRVTTGTTFSAGVQATGTFTKDFPIFSTPPSGIPIEILPIVVAGAPIVEVDLSAYIAADVAVSVTAKADASYEVDQTRAIDFQFSCDGGGCRPGPITQEPTQTTTTKKADFKGQITITPAVYTALQAGFEFDALSVRAGPKPALIGEIDACLGYSASSKVIGGTSSVQQSSGLMADLDWKTDFVWQVLIAGDPILNGTNALVARRHILFRDLLSGSGGSSALFAGVTEAPNPATGHPVLFKVKMPQCYPYADKIQYQVMWTGGASGASTQAGNSACTWNNSQRQGMCFGDPTKELDIALTWPSSGNYSLAVVPVHDSHPRDFQVTPNPIGVDVRLGLVAKPTGPALIKKP